MNGYSIINKKPSIVCLNQRLITKLGANYYSIRKIEMVEKIINSTEDNKALGSLVKTKEKRMKPKGKDSIYIGLANINSDTGEIEVNTVDEANIEGTSVIIEAGDILFSKLRPNLNKVAICPKYIGNALGSTEFVVMESKNIDKYFLYSVLKSNVALKQVIDITTGSTLPRIDSEDVLNILIPIPSPEIQKYIGDKVRRAEELREEAKRLKEEAEEIIESELQFNDLQIHLKDIKSNFGWQSAKDLNIRIDSDYYRPKFIVKENFLKSCKEKFVTLGELIEVIFTGKKLAHHEEGKEVFYIQSGDISTSFLDINTKVKVSDPKLRFLEQKDILFAKDGETIGKLAVNYSNEKMVLNEHTFCIRLKTEYKVYSAYVYYLLCNELINDLIKREATGSAQKGLNQDFVSKIVIPIIDENKIYKLNELEELRCKNIFLSKKLTLEAKQDVEDLIEGKFDMSKLNNDSSTESRC
jgi:type I restriction enzyme S subunit